MKILLTGMSGTGKSSVLEELQHQGFDVVDTDHGGYCLEQNGERLWHESKMHSLLTSSHVTLFVSGCVANQGKFYPLFDKVILLSAPKAIMLERVKNRSNNSYGKTQTEQAEILAHLEEIEPRLRAGCHLEINTGLLSVQAVVQQVLFGVS